MSQARIGLSAVLPCFEEADHLGEVVRALAEQLEGVAGPWEILLVAAEAAGDGTPERAAELARALPGVRRVLQPAGDPGYGRAVALGIAATRYDWVLLMDADGQLDPTDLPRLVARTAEAPAVIGYRAPRADALPRRAAGALHTAVVTRLLGLGPLRDVDCAFKLVERRFLDGAPLRSRTGAVNAELLGRVRARGAVVVQLPVAHRPRRGGRARFEVGWAGAAQLPSPREALAMARDVAALAWRRWRGSAPEEDDR